jgi:hypothetical protein
MPEAGVAHVEASAHQSRTLVPIDRGSKAVANRKLQAADDEAASPLRLHVEKDARDHQVVHQRHNSCETTLATKPPAERVTSKSHYESKSHYYK